MCGHGEPFYFGGDSVEFDVLEVNAAEREAFGMNADTAYVAMTQSHTGFISLRELTVERYAELRAEDEAATSAED